MSYAIKSQFKRGMILMWSGTIATIPGGWALCNGSNSTPDLRNKFIVAADADSAGAAKSTIAGPAAQTGGATTVTLAKGNIPAHVHTYSYVALSGNYDGASSPVATAPTNSTTGDGTADGLKISPDAVTIINPFFSLAYIMKL